jgi:hypothetical protein
VNYARQRRARLGALAFLLVGWAFIGQAGTKEARMDEAAGGRLERVYVGRFSLEVPVGATRYGEEFEVRDLDVNEVAFADPVDMAGEAAWKAKLASIEALKAKRRRPTQIDGDIHSQLQLEPGHFSVVLFHPDDIDFGLDFAALRRSGASGLWLTRPGELATKDQILRTIASVGVAYQPVTSERPRPPGDVFHLPRGVIAAPFQDQEKAKLVFKGGPLGLEIDLFTESTDEPKGGGLLARFAGSVAKAGVALAAGASPVRSRGRTAAGMKGEEFVMRDSKEGNLYFMWEFKGEAGSGTRPRIQLQMITKQEREKEKMAAWDALVDSLRLAAAP